MKKSIFIAFFAALVLSMSAGFAQSPDELIVFTAASLTGAFGEIGEIYENETGIPVAAPDAVAGQGSEGSAARR